MMVYAAFFCVAGYCTINGNAHITGYNTFEQVPFATLVECKQYIRTATMGKIRPDKSGRIVLPNNQGYWECRGRHVETWERQ
jgi:hypothetical protein